LSAVRSAGTRKIAPVLSTVNRGPATPAPPADTMVWRTRLAILLMSLAVVAVYWSPTPPDRVRFAADYDQLHRHRMHYAREALLGPRGELPAWYPRELLGSPFWSNPQNFPFLPTRLLVLVTFDPHGPHAYPFAVGLAAWLAAVFTFLYARRLDLGVVGSAAAGWTFACCGFFAARVAVGHLPLLEAFCALPLLLWVVESASLALGRSDGRRAAWWTIAAGLGAGCLLLAGHPQLPLYALVAASLYALLRTGLRRGALVVGGLLLGAAGASFVLLPMAMLVARSTRVLPLAPAANDIAMPYRRLAGFFSPWLDGAAPPLARARDDPFRGFPSTAYFWDTFGYAGWAPWIAVAALIVLLVVSKGRRPPRPGRVGLFLAGLGAAGVLLSLPLAQPATERLLPGTFLRSPARLIYLTEFALAMGLGAGIDALLRGGFGHRARWLVPLALLAHGIDLARVDREFIVEYSARSFGLPLGDLSRAVDQTIGRPVGGRVGIDYTLPIAINRRHDDVGFFDSILLARPYRALLDLGGAPPDLNVQAISAVDLPLRALQATGVTHVVTLSDRGDLILQTRIGAVNVYRVPLPAERVTFFPAPLVRYASADHIHRLRRDPATDVSLLLSLPEQYRPASEASAPILAAPVLGTSAHVEYRRPDSDHIEATVRTTGTPGILRFLESWDPGWSATLNGAPVPVMPAWDAFLSVAIPEHGRHEVRLVYRTPGAVAGRWVSVAAVVLLGAYGWIIARRLPAAARA
jgi:hypothetical protein